MVNRFSFQCCFQLPAFLPVRAQSLPENTVPRVQRVQCNPNIKTRVPSQALWPDTNQGNHTTERHKFTTTSSFESEFVCEIRCDQRLDVTAPKYFELKTNKKKQPPYESMISLILYLQKRFPENQYKPQEELFFLSRYLFSPPYCGWNWLADVAKLSKPQQCRVNYWWHTNTEINLKHCLGCSPNHYKLGNNNADLWGCWRQFFQPEVT